MTGLLRAVAASLALAALTACGNATTGGCGPQTCVDGCCTAATSSAPSRCLREPLNGDNATCGSGGLTCVDCTTRLDGKKTCVSTVCQ